MYRFIVEIDVGGDWTPDDLRDVILDGMGFPLCVEKEPHRVSVTLMPPPNEKGPASG